MEIIPSGTDASSPNLTLLRGQALEMLRQAHTTLCKWARQREAEKMSSTSVSALAGEVNELIKVLSSRRC